MTTPVPSPFLPGTNVQYAWDSTSLGYLKTCPRLYYYIMIEGWSRRNESIHLRWGQEYHRALEDYDRFRAEGTDHNDSVRQVLLGLLQRIHDWDPEINHAKRSEALKTKEALVRTVIWYLDKFQHDPAKTYIKKDGTPAVELSFQFEIDYGPGLQVPVDGEATFQPYVLCGHLDRVVEFNDDLFVMDRKTTTSTPSSYYFAQYSPNNQMSLYAYASKVILHSNIRGMIIDVAQVLTDTSAFTRGITYRTPDQLDEWMEDLQFWLAEAERFAIEHRWPMNDTACDKFGGCRFREICSMSPSVRGTFLKSNFTKLPEDERWNPLRTR